MYVALLALVAGVGIASEALSLAGPDIAYMLHATRKVVDGARLYQDVIEINPPLIVVLNLPAVLMARVMGWSEIALYRLFTTALLGVSLALSAAVLRRLIPLADEPFRRLVVLMLCFSLFIVGAPDYGQREHLMLALILPYLLLTAVRAGGAAFPGGQAAGIGAMAGVGFALKPHFLLVWLAVELVRRLWQGGHTRRRPEIESVAIGCTLLLYAGLTVLLTPEYLDLVRLLGPEYRAFLGLPIADLILHRGRTPLLLLAAVVTVGLAGGARYRDLWIILLVVMLAAYVAGAAQGKGWRYHFYPAMAILWVLPGLVAVDAWERIGDRVRLLYASLAVAVTGTGILWLTATTALRGAGFDRYERIQQERMAELAAALKGRDLARGVFVFSFATSSAFPLVNYAGLEWTSRFPQLWLLVATYWDELLAAEPLRYRDWKQMPPAERFLNDAVFQDLANYRPGVFLVLRHARDVKGNGPRRIDYLGYFTRDPRIAELLRRYRPVGDVGEYRLYERIPDRAAAVEEVTPIPPGTLDLARRSASSGHGVTANRALFTELVLFFGLVVLTLGVGRRRLAPRSS